MAQQLTEEREAVRSRERRLLALVENASDDILVINSSLQVVFATPAFRDQFGTQEGAASNLGDIVHPDDLEASSPRGARSTPAATAPPQTSRRGSAAATATGAMSGRG